MTSTGWFCFRKNARNSAGNRRRSGSAKGDLAVAVDGAADDCSGVSVGDQAGDDIVGRIGIDPEDEAARCLGVGEDRHVEIINTGTDVESLLDPGQVPAGATGHHAVGRERSGTHDHGNVVDDDLEPDPGFLRHTAGMAEQTEAGDIGGP